MKRIPRIFLICAGALALLAAATAVFITAFVDPNDFKPNIEALAFEATGKQLELRGDLSLSFFPRLGIEAGPAELHDSPAFGSEPFARVEKISASIELAPLFRRKLKIRSLLVSGVRLKLVVNGDGKNNWAVRGKKPGNTATAETAGKNSERPTGLSELALSSLKLEDIFITYTDKQTKTNLEFTVARLALDSLEVGKKTTLDLEASFSGPLARPLPLAVEADFTLPPSLAQGVVFNLTGMLDKTPVNFKGVFAVPGTPEQPLTTLKGDIELGDINLDAYLPARRKAEEKKNGSGKAATESEPADRSARLAAILRPLQIDLRVAARSVTVSGIPVSGIKATIKADQGQVVAKPAAMTVAKGGVSLEATLDARGKDVRTRFTGEWKNADLGELLRAATGKASFTGTCDTAWSLNATGASWSEAVRTLSGTAGASLANGSLPGFALIPRGVANLPAKTLDITGMRGSSSWKITQGVAVSEDLEIRAAAGLSATGKGRVDIPAQNLRCTLSINLPTLPELPELKILPVIVSGPFSALSYSIDQPALLREMTKSILAPSAKAGGEARKAGRELTRELGKGLGKLLGR